MKSPTLAGIVALGLLASHSACAKSQEQKISWGKEDGQMQLGVRLSDESRAYKVGESLDVEVHLRYNGKSPADALIPADLHPGSGNVPSVLNEKGKHAIVRTVIYLGLIPMLPHKLEPGKSQRLGTLQVLLTGPGKDKPDGTELRLGVAPGRYRISQYKYVRVGLKDSKAYDLRSGEVEFRVAPAVEK